VPPKASTRPPKRWPHTRSICGRPCPDCVFAGNTAEQQHRSAQEVSSCVTLACLEPSPQALDVSKQQAGGPSTPEACSMRTSSHLQCPQQQQYVEGRNRHHDPLGPQPRPQRSDQSDCSIQRELAGVHAVRALSAGTRQCSAG
jgi:hypothetical protein